MPTDPTPATPRTAVVGALPKPAWLADGAGFWPRWQLTGGKLHEAQADAAALWTAEQLAAGLAIVSDAEQSRQHFVHSFLEHVAGVDMEAQVNDRRRMVPRIVGALTLRARAYEGEARQLRAATGRPVKVSLPGPLTLADAVVDTHHKDPRALAAAFAAVLNEEAHALARDGVDIVQFDEPALVAWSDDALPGALAALEDAVAGLPCATALHLCDGYSVPPTPHPVTAGTRLLQRYARLFPALAKTSIGMVGVDGCHPFAPVELLDALGDKTVMVGVVSARTRRVESPQDVAQAIARVLAHVPAQRLVATTDWNIAALGREAVVGKLAALVEGARLAADRRAAPLPATRRAAPPALDTAALRQVEADLARRIGPIAKILVAKAHPLCRSIPELREALAASVPPQARAEFLAAPLRTRRAGADPVSGPQLDALLRTAAPFSIRPDELRAFVRALATVVGPVAPILARRQLGRSPDFGAFVGAVAATLDTAVLRERFLAQLRTALPGRDVGRPAGSAH